MNSKKVHTALAPCPFCGGASQVSKGWANEAVWAHGDFHRVFCTACQARQLFYKTEAEAIAAWNGRSAIASRAPAVATVPEGAYAITPPEFPKYNPDGLEGQGTREMLWQYAMLVGYRHAPATASAQVGDQKQEQVNINDSCAPKVNYKAADGAGELPLVWRLVKKCQDVLSRHLPPDGLSGKDTISELLGLLDGPEYRAALAQRPNNILTWEQRAKNAGDWPLFSGDAVAPYMKKELEEYRAQRPVIQQPDVILQARSPEVTAWEDVDAETYQHAESNGFEVRKVFAQRPVSAAPVAYLKQWDSVGGARKGMQRLDFSVENEQWLDNVFPTVTPLYAQPTSAIQESELVALLPGPYYMDLPDGGSVSVMEQLRRMAEDAARYAWLRGQHANGGELDTRVDAARGRK